MASTRAPVYLPIDLARAHRAASGPAAALARDALRGLMTRGCARVTIPGLATVAERALEMLHEFSRSVGAPFNVNDSDTWSKVNQISGSYGIVQNYGVGQSKAQWLVRTCPELLEFVHALHGTAIHDPDELAASFDGVVYHGTSEADAARNAKAAKDNTPAHMPVHVDQPMLPPSQASVGPVALQMQVLLTDSSPEDGDASFACVPYGWQWLRKHQDAVDDPKAKFSKLKPDAIERMLAAEMPTRSGSTRKLRLVPIGGKRGDVIIWRSDTPHCNILATRESFRAVSFQSFLRSVLIPSDQLALRHLQFRSGRSSGAIVSRGTEPFSDFPQPRNLKRLRFDPAVPPSLYEELARASDVEPRAGNDASFVPEPIRSLSCYRSSADYRSLEAKRAAANSKRAASRKAREEQKESDARTHEREHERD